VNADAMLFLPFGYKNRCGSRRAIRAALVWQTRWRCIDLKRPARFSSSRRHRQPDAGPRARRLPPSASSAPAGERAGARRGPATRIPAITVIEGDETQIGSYLAGRSMTRQRRLQPADQMVLGEAQHALFDMSRALGPGGRFPPADKRLHSPLAVERLGIAGRRSPGLAEPSSRADLGLLETP